MYCTSCGKELIAGARFCIQCGTPVIQPEMGNKAFDNMNSHMDQQSYEAMNQKSSMPSNQQQYLNQTGYPYQWSPQLPREGISGLAVASMVLGIISLITSLSWSILTKPIVPGLMSVLAIVFSFSPLFKKKRGWGMAIAGLICGLIAIFRVIYLWTNIVGFINDTRTLF